MTNTRIPQTITTQADMDAVLSVPDTYTLTPGTRVLVNEPTLGMVIGHVVDHFVGRVSGEPMIHLTIKGTTWPLYLTDIVEVLDDFPAQSGDLADTIMHARVWLSEFVGVRGVEYRDDVEVLHLTNRFHLDGLRGLTMSISDSGHSDLDSLPTS
jgi:hypothetical protein